jgi:hypothetical protein
MRWFPARGMAVPALLAFKMALCRGNATTGGTPVPRRYDNLVVPLRIQACPPLNATQTFVR